MQFFIKNDARQTHQLYMIISSADGVYYLLLKFEQQMLDIQMAHSATFYKSEILNEAH